MHQVNQAAIETTEIEIGHMPCWAQSRGDLSNHIHIVGFLKWKDTFIGAKMIRQTSAYSRHASGAASNIHVPKAF